MELKDWINIIAIVLSPIVAVLITMWLTTRMKTQGEDGGLQAINDIKSCFRNNRLC